MNGFGEFLRAFRARVPSGTVVFFYFGKREDGRPAWRSVWTVRCTVALASFRTADPRRIWMIQRSGSAEESGFRCSPDSSGLLIDM